MKAVHFLSVLSLVFTLATTHAQKVQTYKVWVTLVNNTQVKGTLHAANENEIVILDKDLVQINLARETIGIIKIRKKGSIGRGALLGTASGALAGGVIGYAGGDDEPGILSFSAEDKAAIGAILAAPVGALVGIAIGSGREEFVINGSKKVYASFLPAFQRYAAQQGH